MFTRKGVVWTQNQIDSRYKDSYCVNNGLIVDSYIHFFIRSCDDPYIEHINGNVKQHLILLQRRPLHRLCIDLNLNKCKEYLMIIKKYIDMGYTYIENSHKNKSQKHIRHAHLVLIDK